MQFALSKMSISAPEPNFMGKSVSSTLPLQSPSAISNEGQSANPQELNNIEEDAEDKRDQQYTTGVHPHGLDGGYVPAEENRPPELPAASTVKKDPPLLPARPPSQEPASPPKPIPNLPPRAAPTSPRERTTLRPPTMVQDPSMSEGGHNSFKYTREAHKLVAYFIPLPKPKLSKNTVDEETFPDVGVACLTNQ